jgi:transcriptional regulator with XRE-family HTH domain
MEYRDIGENIRKYRNRLDLTQEELADRIGITWEMISRYERGESSPMNKLHQISDALGVPMTDLIDDSLHNDCEVPLFMKIPKNLIFNKNNTTLFYSCPKWLLKRDPEIFVINSQIVKSNNFIKSKNGYIFISPNSKLENSDLVISHHSGNLIIEEFKVNNSHNIGKLMMQEVLFV